MPDLSEQSCCSLCCGCLCLTLCCPICLICSPFLCCYCCCCSAPSQESAEGANPIGPDETQQLTQLAIPRQNYRGAEDVAPLARRGGQDSFESAPSPNAALRGGGFELNELNLAKLQSGTFVVVVVVVVVVVLKCY
jgi:hypothetical protein